MFSAKERKIWSKLNFPKIKKIKNKKASFLWHTQIFLYPNNCTVHEKYLTEIDKDMTSGMRMITHPKTNSKTK